MELGGKGVIPNKREQKGVASFLVFPTPEICAIGMCLAKRTFGANKYPPSSAH